MANTKERIDALEAQIQSMFKGDEDAPGILKQFSIRLDALEVNLEATDNARYAENMDWEGKFQELHDRVEHHTRHTEGIDWESKFQELQDRVELLSRLKPWARTELNRRRVNNLNEAIIAAESLSDYNSEPQRPPQRGNPNRSNGGKKPGSQAPNQSWGSKSSWASNSSTLQKSGVGFKAKPDASTSGEVKKPAFRGCFLCQGPHVIANCPQRQMMNAFFDNMGQVQRGEQSGSQSRHPPTEEQTDTQDYEEEDAVGAFPQWRNAVTTQVGNPEESSTGEKPKDMPPKKKSDVPGKGLMYVDIKVNGKAIRAMVDTGATHNYISSTEVERLGLTLEKGCGRVKAINSAAQPVAGIARSVLIKIGPYEGRTNFSVVIMDDFKLILGLEFLRDTKTTVMPCTNSLAMLGSKPCVIPTVSTRAGERSISALQLKKGLKRDDTTYLAMLRLELAPLHLKLHLPYNNSVNHLAAASTSFPRRDVLGEIKDEAEDKFDEDTWFAADEKRNKMTKESIVELLEECHLPPPFSARTSGYPVMVHDFIRLCLEVCFIKNVAKRVGWYYIHNRIRVIKGGPKSNKGWHSRYFFIQRPSGKWEFPRKWNGFCKDYEKKGFLAPNATIKKLLDHIKRRGVLNIDEPLTD
ncbi:hypothetical protein RJ640_001983 [Escallonia rubra]|uniref:Peptidase A2 domain-containing protein n=1 Tax=Escallonia rubra TaxID=112253 RepID=A0AA88S2T1_9ASTE|nr:hypothetical protein RJ640_001983 [Escallonia rubra]